MASRPRFTNRDRLNRRFEATRTVPRTAVVRALTRGAIAIQGDAQVSIQTQTPSGKKVRSRGNKAELHEVSPPGSPPNADTGNLHTSIAIAFTRSDNLTVEVGSNVPYGTDLELGTSKMAPRPYMSPAFHRNVGRIEGWIIAAIRRALREAAGR